MIIQQEIQEQPTVLNRLIALEMPTIERIAQAIRKFDPVFVLIAARGTSDNAARYAQYLFGIRLGLPVALATPSIHTLYDSNPRVERALVIGISQSGQSEDVRRVVRDAKAQGALTVGITNDPQSPLAQESQYHINLQCGEERSVAATKTYTAELTAVALLTSQMIGDSAALTRIPNLIQETLDMALERVEWIQRYRYAEGIATIGRGYNYSTAYEISLKIKELCYITGEEYSEADFRHGPIAIIKPGFPVIVVAPRGKTLDLSLDLLQRLNKKKAECIVISNDDQANELASFVMKIPQDLPEWLSPICAVVPGQVFAMNLALYKGHTVDTPEGLQKVTVTR